MSIKLSPLEDVYYEQRKAAGNRPALVLARHYMTEAQAPSTLKPVSIRRADGSVILESDESGAPPAAWVVRSAPKHKLGKITERMASECSATPDLDKFRRNWRDMYENRPQANREDSLVYFIQLSPKSTTEVADLIRQMG